MKVVSKKQYEKILADEQWKKWYGLLPNYFMAGVDPINDYPPIIYIRPNNRNIQLNIGSGLMETVIKMNQELARLIR